MVAYLFFHLLCLWKSTGRQREQDGLLCLQSHVLPGRTCCTEVDYDHPITLQLLCISAQGATRLAYKPASRVARPAVKFEYSGTILPAGVVQRSS
jgi:hypothetical protein